MPADRSPPRCARASASSPDEVRSAAAAGRRAGAAAGAGSLRGWRAWLCWRWRLFLALALGLRSGRSVVQPGHRRAGRATRRAPAAPGSPTCSTSSSAIGACWCRCALGWPGACGSSLDRRLAWPWLPMLALPLALLALVPSSPRRAVPEASWPFRVGLGGFVGDLLWRRLGPVIGRRRLLSWRRARGGAALVTRLGLRWRESAGWPAASAAGSPGSAGRLGEAAGLRRARPWPTVRDWRSHEARRQRSTSSERLSGLPVLDARAACAGFGRRPDWSPSRWLPAVPSCARPHAAPPACARAMRDDEPEADAPARDRPAAAVPGAGREPRGRCRPPQAQPRPVSPSAHERSGDAPSSCPRSTCWPAPSTTASR